MHVKTRLGRIEYLNVLPVYFALENLWEENGFRLVPGTPADLNARMRRGELDLSSISSLEYGRHPEKYLLLPDFSISSQGAVGSVLLFSRAPFDRLDGRPVLVSSASATGAALLKVLMAELFQVQPDYRSGSVSAGLAAGCAAIFAIGDEALKLRAAGAMPYQLDLGAAWQELTGLPFVFGVWAVRRDFARSRPGETAAMHRLLLRSRDWGLQALPELSRFAAAFSEMTSEQTLAYFRQLDFSLSSEQENGLGAFFQYMQERGELASAPELEYFSR